MTTNTWTVDNAPTVTWIKHPERDAFRTKTVDPRDGRTYYGGSWVPRTFAERMGMTQYEVSARA